MGPFDTSDAKQSSGPNEFEFPITRRTFLGSVGAMTVASGAFGQDVDKSDETALRFAWSNDPEAEGARVLDISIVTRDPVKPNEPEPSTDAAAPPEADAAPSEFADITEQSRGRTRDRFWRLRPESFGPRVYFALKTRTSKNGLLIYELRVADVSYGRLKPRPGQRRSIIFVFTQTIVPLPGEPETKVKRFVLTAKTDIWSSERGPAELRTFEMSGKVEKDIRHPLLFRDFLIQSESGRQQDHSRDLYIDVPLKRITNTAALMFNGLITRRPRAGNPSVDLWFSSSGVWHVRSDRAALGAFGGRVALSSLDIFWPTVAKRETGAASEAPLFGAATPDWASSQRIEIGDGRDAPGFRGSWDEKTKRVFFRMQAPEGAPEAANLLRAEAMLQSEWTGVSFEGRTDVHSVRRLPIMVGSLLERADHADVLDNAFPAANSGSVGFQARYGRTADSGNAAAPASAERTETPIGQLVTQPIRDGDVESADQDFSFPKRRGWPVTALFDWPGQAGGSRTKPVTQLIDAEVGIVEAGVALPGAQYSRLTFAPSALRIFYSRNALERPPIGSFLDLAPRKGAEFARLDLSRAALRASRSENLLALKFGFSDLALSFRDDGQEFVSYNTSCDITTRSGDFDELQPHDTRPTLVVEFPPQHLFEEARYFQTAPPLPDVEIKQKLTYNRETRKLDAAAYDNETRPFFSVTETEIVFDSDSRVHLSDAIATLLRAGKDPTPFRKQVRNFKRKKSATSASAQEQFREFDDSLRAATPKIAGAPAHQFVYIGPVGMDVDVRQYVRKMFDAYWQSKAKPIVDKMLGDALGHAHRIKPETEVQNFDEALRIALQVEGMLPLYQRYRDFWREQMVSLLIAPETAAPEVRKLADRPKRSDPTEIEHVPLSAAKAAKLIKTLDAGILTRRAAAVTVAFQNALFQREDLAKPSRARLSNPSRLAFRVNCRDGLDAIRIRKDLDLDQPEDDAQRLPRESLPFHLDTLTTFQGMELAVTARAEIIYDPGELGLISARRARIADTSGDAMLARLGFRMDNEISARTRLADIATSLKPPTALETAIEIPARLTLSPHQNAVVLTSGRNLFADRDGDAFDYDPPAGEPKQRAEKPVIRETEALWQAQFVTQADGLGLNPGLRAVHSPDLRPGALLTRFAEQDTGMPLAEPPGGAFDPWFLSRIQGQSPTMSKAELDQLQHLQETDANGKVLTACELPANEVPGLVARLCAFFRERNTPATKDITRFRGPMDARDRHQLVLLSSAWGLPVIGRRDEGGTLKRDSSQFEPTSRSAVWDVMPGSAIYQPRTLDVTELALSGIGGTLRHDTGFQPPAGALFWQDNAPIFDALGIERWQQWTNLGRDIYTEIVYKGFLFPLGLRASLVKVTERIFHMDVVTGAISAPLRQRMYIRVADPEKLYPAVKQPFGGRRFPVKRLNLLTTTTPDIVDPNDDDPAGTGVGANGRVKLGSNSRGIAFWPRMFGAEAGNIRFEMDVDGVKTDLPLIFVDNTAANHQRSLQELVRYYASVATPEEGKNPAPVMPTKHLRTLIFGGAERRYAEEVESGGATFQTDHWTLSATGLHDKIVKTDRKPDEAFETYTFKSDGHVFGPTLQGADQPPFYPVMETARVHLTQTERLIGRNLPPVRAHFDARYLAHGFVANGSTAEASTLINPVPKVNASEVVLILRDQLPLDMGRKGDQSGGVYRPSGLVAALSRSKGALTHSGRPKPIKLPDITTAGVHGFSDLFTLAQGTVTAPDNSGLPTGTEGQSQDSFPPDPETGDVSEVLEEIRKIYKDYLGDGSKILGLVSLRELIDLIQRLSSPDEGLPDLAEKTEFGAGILQGVEDAATVIRERIVAPLAAAVRRIRDGWDEIETQLNEGQSRIGVPVNPVTISEIFPELDNALTRLADALARAEGETDEIAFALELGACYSSGQQFLGSLERAAANPGQRVEEALSSRYTEVLGLFRALQDGIGPWLTNMTARAIWQLNGSALPQGKIDALDLEQLLEDNGLALAGKIEAVVQEALSAAVEKGGSLTREIIRLPRTPGIYEGPIKNGKTPDMRFQDCIRTLIPNDADIEVVLNALAEWLLFPDRVISFVTGGVPEPQALLDGFLDDPVTLGFDNQKIADFFAGMSGTVGEHVDEKVDDLATRIVGEITKVETAKNIDLGDLKAEIAALAEEVKADLHTANGRVFEGGETDATKALRTGNVRTQIRNRYIACVVLNMIADPDGCIPELVDLDPEWLRDFFRWLRSLLRLPDDDLPDLPNIFQPILDLLNEIFQLLAELAKLVKMLADGKRPDFGPLLAFLRRIFDQISIPGPPDDLCRAIKPAWDGAAYAMRAVADLGDVLTRPRPDTNGIVFHPPDWTGPACPFGDTSQARHVDENWQVTPFSKAHPNSLNASIFAIRAYTDVLKDITGRNADAFKDAVTDGQMEQEKLFDAYEALIADIQAKLEDLRDKLPAAITAATNETERQRLLALQTSVNQKIALLLGSVDETRRRMEKLSDASGNAHCSLSDASDAIARLSTDLRRAAALPICGTGSFDQTAFDALKAMAHLLGDVRSARDRIEKLSQDMRVFVHTLVDTLEGIANTANTQPVVLLVLAVPAETLLDGFTLASDSAQFQTEIEAANDARDALQAWVAARSDQTVPLVREITKALCRAIEQVDALRARIEALLDEAELWMTRADEALKDGTVTEPFRPLFARLLAEIRRGVDLDRRRADLVEVRKVFDVLRDIRDKLCPKNPDGSEMEIEPDPAKPLAMLSAPDAKVPNSEAQVLSKLEEIFAPGNQIERLAVTATQFAAGLQPLADELRQFTDAAPREVLQSALTPYVKMLIAQRISVPDSSLTDGSGDLTLASLYAVLAKLRNDAYDQLDVLPAADILQEAFVVPPDGARQKVGSLFDPAKFVTAGQGKNPKHDQLSGDVAWLRKLTAAPSLPVTEAEMRFLTEFTREWASGEATPLFIFEQIVELVDDILSGGVFKNIDFARIREEVEDYLLSLVPSKIRMGYGFNIELGDEVAKATAGIFAPKPGTRLGIDMKIVIDLLKATQGDVDIDFRSVGTLGPFDIKLVGKMFDALTLSFASAEFVTEGGGKSDIRIVYTDHKIGPQLKFVEKLQKYLAPKDGSGAIIRFYPNQPGLEAGYRLHLGDFSVGNLAFTNVGLETTAILPFSDSEALFKASLSSRPNPFTLTYAPYGGSGFFAIFATVEGIVGFEASFEFGGSGVFAAGPLSGQGRIMSGVYIRQLKLNGVKITEISMTFFAGGSASIWIFNFAAALSVKLGMINGNMTGEATFSFSFSMGLADFEYSITMFKQEGEGFQGQSASLGTTRTASLADPALPLQKTNKFGAIVETAGQCQSRNWKAFKSYFDDTTDLGDYF